MHCSDTGTVPSALHSRVRSCPTGFGTTIDLMDQSCNASQWTMGDSARACLYYPRSLPSDPRPRRGSRRRSLSSVLCSLSSQTPLSPSMVFSDSVSSRTTAHRLTLDSPIPILRHPRSPAIPIDSSPPCLFLFSSAPPAVPPPTLGIATLAIIHYRNGKSRQRNQLLGTP
ncbi:hypothetical protein BT67DRAFT_131142 [Trichocladium antarcticum]|uniref:Uncharacterized protein n=1 Tax=Trichocladium antarcticum TaxID=1450529 RepID=A0AAN6ZHT8_9PEZI|nr:hypothetical protein BT67DRAFT_131142 [Trichocladium antarcticum]